MLPSLDSNTSCMRLLRNNLIDYLPDIELIQKKRQETAVFFVKLVEIIPALW